MVKARGNPGASRLSGCVADQHPAGRRGRASLADLVAFLGVLALAAGLAFLLDRTGQLSARLAFAGAAGLTASCVTAWRRLRRVELRRWRSGQLAYHGRRVTMVSSWGVEGQSAPAIEPQSGPGAATPDTTPSAAQGSDTELNGRG